MDDSSCGTELQQLQRVIIIHGYRHSHILYPAIYTQRLVINYAFFPISHSNCLKADEYLGSKPDVVRKDCQTYLNGIINC